MAKQIPLALSKMFSSFKPCLLFLTLPSVYIVRSLLTLSVLALILSNKNFLNIQSMTFKHGVWKFISEQDSGKYCVKGMTSCYENAIFDTIFGQISHFNIFSNNKIFQTSSNSLCKVSYGIKLHNFVRGFWCHRCYAVHVWTFQPCVVHSIKLKNISW